MRKPNYSMERKDRERAKQAKAAAKVEKRASKGVEDRESDVGTTANHINPVDVDRTKSND